MNRTWYLEFIRSRTLIRFCVWIRTAEDGVIKLYRCFVFMQFVLYVIFVLECCFECIVYHMRWVIVNIHWLILFFFFLSFLFHPSLHGHPCHQTWVQAPDAEPRCQLKIQQPGLFLLVWLQTGPWTLSHMSSIFYCSLNIGGMQILQISFDCFQSIISNNILWFHSFSVFE